ncbi:hypothetical protein [Symbioplanes lichenis]|uniref:hypothetical protein n=1 Tax=Symbioplanes lichenis TaxID=1629072 RepID=UPI0027385914|nr:hypothetical protein [Actinoplanes lichenis]
MATKRSVQQRRKNRRRAALVMVPTVAGVFVAGTAFAYWTTSGAGTATSTAGTNTAVTVTGVGATGLTPGGTAQPITFTINNPGTTAQYISSVAVSIASVTKASGATGSDCTAADFTLTQPNAINEDIASGSKSYGSTQGAKIAMINTAVNQDGCKGATINLAFAAS